VQEEVIRKWEGVGFGARKKWQERLRRQ